MQRIAAVAVIVRGVGCGGSPILDQSAIRQGQVLFIERAVNARDRYSGHIAFPGGRRQSEELPVEVSIRETLEEVGLDLNDSDKFRLLGTLSLVNRCGLVVHPFVFQQICSVTPSLRLQKSEVKAAFWVPIEYLLTANIHWNRFSFTKVMLPASWSSVMSRVVCAHLPDCVVALLKRAVSLPSIELPMDSGDPPRQLWGMSLQIIAELFHVAGLQRFHDLSPFRIRLVNGVFELLVLARAAYKTKTNL